MCKIAIISGITPETKDKAWEFVKAMAKEMSDFQNRDGLGYAAVDGNGVMFGERWWTNSDAFSERNPLTELDRNILNAFNGMLGKTISYNNFGEGIDFEDVEQTDLRSIILHTRLATSGKEFNNTHPFVINNTALIHNGIIRNADKLGLKNSTCDSEAILVQYENENVRNSVANIQDVADKLEGYYACGIISKTDEGRMIVDVFKDKSASLSAFFIKELNTVVFATSELAVKSACRTLSFEIVSEYLVRAGCLVRFDALTGRVIETQRFNTVGPERFKKEVEVTPPSSHSSWLGQHSQCSVPDPALPILKSLPKSTVDDIDDNKWSEIMAGRLIEQRGVELTTVEKEALLATEGVVYEDYVLDKQTQKWTKPGKKHGGKHGNNGGHNNHHRRR